MLTVEIILFVISIMGLIFSIKREEAGWASYISFLISALLACIIFDLTIPHNVRKLRSSNYNVKTEIRVNVVNGREVSRDTVYIFTPKKK